jgi:hypothetical protein
VKRAALLLLAACAGPARPGGPSPGAPPDAGLANTLPADAAVATPLVCVPGANQQAEFNLYDERRAVTHDDGTFVDRCDSGGSLMQYQCEQIGVRCAGGGGRGGFELRRPSRPCYQQTGRAIRESIDCDGRCRDGVCPTRCPQFGDKLVFRSIDASGHPTFDSAADDRHITCSLAYDQKNDTFDCVRDQRVGNPFVVEGLGLSTTMCAGGVWGAVSDSRCTYAQCSYVR